MVVESVVSSIIVGKVRKGKIGNIEKVELRGWYLFIAAFLLEAAANFLSLRSSEPVKQFLRGNFIYIHSLSYILLFLCIGLNCKRKSMWLVFAGTLMNFLVIIFNGGHMPVWFEGVKIAGIIKPDAVEAGIDLTHSFITETTRLKFLADIIPLPRPYPFPKVLSPGDILLAAGVFIFIQEAMLPAEKED